jgi:acyl-CoA synthetase (AMP-forming)/AMP-acid ligase II
MSSYLNRDTAGVVTGDGWLNTGDIVELSADRVFFRGRRDLLLNVGGAKVRPEEVEAALDALPEVAESRVYGIANPVTGMLVAAEIVPAAGGDPNVLRRSILQQLRARLEPYKVPRIVKLVDSIAVSAAGKKGRVER